MASMTALEQYRAVQLLASIQELLTLDSLWTHLHEGHRPGDRDRGQALGQLARDMDRLLEQIHAGAPLIRRLVEGNADATYAAFTRLVADARIAEATRQGLRKKLPTASSFADQVSRSAQTLVEGAARERQDIAAKARAVSAGGTSAGDITQGTRCALILGGIALGAGLTFGGVAFIGGFVLGVYGGMFVDEC